MAHQLSIDIVCHTDVSPVVPNDEILITTGTVGNRRVKIVLIGTRYHKVCAGKFAVMHHTLTVNTGSGKP